MIRNTDNWSLRKALKHRARRTDYFSSKRRKVNFVIYVANGLSVMKAMETTSTSEAQYINTVVSTFNSPYLSFKGISESTI